MQAHAQTHAHHICSPRLTQTSCTCRLLKWRSVALELNAKEKARALLGVSMPKDGELSLPAFFQWTTAHFLDGLSQMSSLIRLGWLAGELQASTHLRFLNTGTTMPASVPGFWRTCWWSNSGHHAHTATAPTTEPSLWCPSCPSLCLRSHIYSCKSLGTWHTHVMCFHSIHSMTWRSLGPSEKPPQTGLITYVRHHHHSAKWTIMSSISRENNENVKLMLY